MLENRQECRTNFSCGQIELPADKSSSNAFDTIVSPVTRRQFFLDYWGQNYLISNGGADRFSRLFGWEALSEILSTQRFVFPRMRLLSGGRVAPPAQYIVNKVDRRGHPYQTHDATAVKRMLDDGAMLHITSIGETWTPLASFASELESVVGGKVQVNVHAGYAGSKGFHTHWDGHDVYAAQIDGNKNWRLFGFTDKAPIAVPPDEKHDAPKQYCWEGELRTGQVLYLPRGYWHATQFLDCPSLHLTFAVQHPTGMDFVQWLARQFAEYAEMRQDIPLPVFNLPDVGQPTKTQYVSRLQELVSNAISSEVMELFLSDYRASLGTTNHIQLDPETRSRHAT